MRRASTLAEHARLLAAYSDSIVTAVRSGNLELVEHARDVVRQLWPPHGFDAMDALMVVLAAQIDQTVPVEKRLGWVREFDPARGAA